MVGWLPHDGNGQGYAEREVVTEINLNSLFDFQCGEFRGELFESDARLKLAQHVANAVVNAKAK